MKKLLSFVLACLTLVMTLAVSASAWAAKKEAGTYTKEDVYELLNQSEYVPGQILVYFSDDVSYEDAKKSLIGLGLPSDFTDQSVYVSDAYAKYGQTVRFCIYVTEARMAEMLWAFLTTEGISFACPNYVSYPDLSEKIGDLNGDNSIDAFDYMFLKAAVLGSYELNDNQREFADLNHDGYIDAFDYQLLKSMILHPYPTPDGID